MSETACNLFLLPIFPSITACISNMKSHSELVRIMWPVSGMTARTV